MEALERRARLDPNRLPRGRTYARTGAVGVLTLAPGEILADVQGSRRSPYKVRVRVRPFDEAEWHRLLDALAAEIGHTAALLDGELPAGVADDIRSVGLDLLPGAGSSTALLVPGLGRSLQARRRGLLPRRRCPRRRSLRRAVAPRRGRDRSPGWSAFPAPR